MVLAVHAGCVGEMGVLTTQFPGLSVHMGYEILDGAIYFYRQYIGGVGGGGEHDTVEQVLHRHDFALLQAGHHIAGAGGDILHPGRAGGDHGRGRELTVLNGFQHQKGGHDLGSAGGIGLLIGPLVVQYLVVIGIQQYRVGAKQVRLLQGSGWGGEQSQYHGEQQK